MIRLLKKYTASIDIDCQKGFTPICPNELPIPDGHTIVDQLNEQATFARIRVCTKDWHPHNAVWIASEDHPHLSYVSAYYVASHPNVDLYWKAHCLVGTQGAELLDGLPYENDYDFVVYKGLERDMHPYGAAYHDLEEKRSTGLIEFLRCNHIANVIIGGLAFDYCVFKTAIQLYKNGFNVIVNKSACKALKDVEKTEDRLIQCGVHMIESSGDLIFKG